MIIVIEWETLLDTLTQESDEAEQVSTVDILV